MSNDLISRKAVLESIDELLKSPYATNNEYYTCHIRDGIKMVRDVCVKASATAYDVENVIKELKHESECKDTDLCADGGTNCTWCKHYGVDMETAIDIVKKGGFE